ncbi:uncharacterized protein LOC131683234 [Topomyia yanbarensis]|uniref:uncharacterized protein LOC131683234 n=1 Tax=Topomyia yanbarensis TaxID=2498891 RepID=UPI00273A8B42|nr:uncharacterized protein LOC131683234 [Topomyia yanbarensis]
MHHGAVWNGKLARWDHLRNLYEEDSRRLPRAAPKLTRKHVYLPAFGEMRVHTATQTLSASVYAAFTMYIREGTLPQEFDATAMYCRDFNNLFDVFNASKNARHQQKEFLQPLNADCSHWNCLEKMESKLRELRFIDNKCNSLDEEDNFKALPKCSRYPWFINGWLLCISSLECLFKDLTSHFNFSEISPRSLNQDGLENFFGLIRMKNANNNRPDCTLFRSAYRGAVVNQLLSSRAKGNCEADTGLVQCERFSKNKFENR